MVNDICTWNYTRGNAVFDEKLEYEMLLEELVEFYEATTAVDRADALADIIFVAVGSLYKLTGSAHKAESIMAEVITANFKKGSTKDENGKIVKPQDFVGPEKEIAKILEDDTEGLWGSYLEKNGHIYG